MHRFLRAPTTDVFVAEGPEGLVGYAMIGFRSTSRLGRIFSLAVDRRRERQGVGRALLNGCERQAQARRCVAVRLEVRDDNTGAVALYERAGYRRIGSEADYYEDGATALKFEKRLDGGH